MSKLLLATVALFAFATPSFAQPTGPLSPNPTHNGLREPGLAAVPTDAFAFISVKASKLWDNPAAKSFRDWVASQKGDPFSTYIGVPLADVDRITMMSPTVELRDGFVMLITTRKPYDEAKVFKALGVGQPGDKPYRRTGRVIELHGDAADSVALVDDRTLLFTKESRNDRARVVLLSQLIARKSDGPLATALADAAHHDITVGLNVPALVEALEAEALEEKDPVRPFLPLVNARTATLTIDFEKTARAKLVLTYPNAAAAKRAEPALEGGIKFLSEQVDDANRPGPGGSLIEKFVVPSAAALLKNTKVTVDGMTVTASGDFPYTDEVAKLVATLPKSFKNERKSAVAKNNLKQLALGMHNIHDTYEYIPGDIAPGGGDKPVAWSWRVQMLPYIEQNQIFSQLDTTKPWNDPANLKILEETPMPKIFEHPGRTAPKGHTFFRVFSLPKNAKGTDTPFFEEGKRGPKLQDIADGTSNTLMIVEAGEAVPWYKPDVLAYDGKLALPQLGDKEGDSFLAAMGDGSVRTFKLSKLDEKTLRALITRAGGEVIPEIEE